MKTQLSTVHDVTADICSPKGTLLMWRRYRCHLEAKRGSAEDDPCGFVFRSATSADRLRTKMISGVAAADKNRINWYHGVDNVASLGEPRLAVLDLVPSVTTATVVRGLAL